VSVDSIQSVAGWKGVSSALQEIRDCHAETWAFFHGIFEELNLFSISLDAHKRHLVQTIPAGEGAPQAASPDFGERLSHLISQREAEREETRETRESVREQVAHLAAVAAELASAQGAFQTNFQLIREDIAKNREALAREAAAVPATNNEANGDLERKLTDLERQHAALEQDRAVLEKELEGVRNRAADLAESLAEQKRLTTQQQTQGNAELQRMRQLLETLARQETFARQNHEIEPSPSPIEPVVPLVAKTEPQTAAADPVLGSVLAQFEMLQQDRARRRA
jgi:DNA repair exonuclease SbcCD ATPase subunit